MTSDTQLSLRAQVHYDTLQNWYSGRTIPRPAELRKVADALGIRYSDLQDAYDGRDPEPPTLVMAIEELIVELRRQREEQHQATSAILRTLGAVLPELVAAGERR
jgi:transcriptional regulator with XRE-family HTH domain